MERLEKFYEAIDNEMAVPLATCAGGRVTMRLVSPAPYRGSMLIFTDAASEKYRQLLENPMCCVGCGSLFAEAEAEFFGSTMAEENGALRDAYTAKYADAFKEGVEYGGRAAEFILLHPKRLSGWEQVGDSSFPNVPFSETL